MCWTTIPVIPSLQNQVAMDHRSPQSSTFERCWVEERWCNLVAALTCLGLNSSQLKGNYCICYLLIEHLRCQDWTRGPSPYKTLQMSSCIRPWKSITFSCLYLPRTPVNTRETSTFNSLCLLKSLLCHPHSLIKEAKEGRQARKPCPLIWKLDPSCLQHCTLKYWI